MIRDMAEPTMSIADVDAMLTGEGGFFETVPVIVNGVEVIMRRTVHRTCEPAPELRQSRRRRQRPLLRVRRRDRGDLCREHRHRASLAAARRAVWHRSGDRAAILAANTPEWIQSFWAITSLGAIAVAMNGWWTEDEIRYGLELTRPAAARRRQTGRTHHRRPGSPARRVRAGLCRTSRSRTRSELPVTPIDEDDAATILFTSGTTGRPKGADTLPELQRLSHVRVHPRRPHAPASRPIPTTRRTPDAVAGRQPPVPHLRSIHAASMSGLGHGPRLDHRPV